MYSALRLRILRLYIYISIFVCINIYQYLYAAMEMKRDESMNTTLDQNSKFVPRLLNPGFMQEKIYFNN